MGVSPSPRTCGHQANNPGVTMLPGNGGLSEVVLYNKWNWWPVCGVFFLRRSNLSVLLLQEEREKRKENNGATRAMTTSVGHGYAVKGQICICLKWQAANFSACFKCLWKIIKIKIFNFGDFGVLISGRSFRSAWTTRGRSHTTITTLSRERFLLFQRQIASSDAHTGIKTAFRCSLTPSYLRSISNP